jgi:hypothetical protein
MCVADAQVYSRGCTFAHRPRTSLLTRNPRIRFFKVASDTFTEKLPNLKLLVVLAVDVVPGCEFCIEFCISPNSRAAAFAHRLNPRVTSVVTAV